ncbi:hypothetical protein KAR91_59785 [Candidatus Pacearchaeota archaeon]|nr:hypothetical protein [Candidatus Pacearchaeota archaeon]
MTDTNDDAPPPAQEVPPSDSPPPTPPPSDAPPVAGDDTPPPEYKIPDEYKDKPWAAKIKTEEDVFKQIDNLTGLVGKKHLTPDFKTATPADIEAYYESTRPADKKEYIIDGEASSPEIRGKVADLLHKNGITAHQGSALIKELGDLGLGELDTLTSEEGFNTEMTKSFGDKFKPTVASVVIEHKKHLSVDDQKLMDKIPNEFLGVVYRLTDKMTKAYGAKETGAQVDGGGGSPPTPDFDKESAAISAEIRALDGRAHSAEEKQILINKRHEIIRRKAAAKK